MNTKFLKRWRDICFFPAQGALWLSMLRHPLTRLSCSQCRNPTEACNLLPVPYRGRAAVRQVQWAVAGGDALCRGGGFRLAVADENVTEKLCALMTSVAAAS